MTPAPQPKPLSVLMKETMQVIRTDKKNGITTEA
jgi:hypothetical protein